MVFKLHYSKRFFIFTLLAGAFSSCSIFDTKEQIPSYIHIDKIIFSPTDTTVQGTASSKITDAWVYIDDQLVGTYELPATFPVQYAGVHSVSVLPGIKQNGISSTRVKYPFYSGYITSVTLTPKQTTVINPSAKYFPAISFDMIEDFEGAGYCLRDTFGQAKLNVVVGAQAWGGGKSVHTKLAGDTLVFQARSCTTYAMTADGRAKFIELNYKCNHNFVVGLTFGAGTSPIVGVNPSATWNKIYINIPPDQILATGQYGFYIAMQKLLTDQDVPEIYIDNIKLIHN